ncbi:hypothetical protein SCHPADRAFT_425975 [Schizopora paradoxa]|uniref:Peptidase C14 caspase domain-containing protein n=1 Tax=Schizopora paradoxa TaxID=27342 RepID=A0A0H2RJZ8_9AGAM|nr:hypothetical protein SCHPADRAFT_425975 [Schizopora paradoxa]
MWNEQYHHRVRAHSFSGHARSPAMHLGRIPSPNAMTASARQPSPMPPTLAAGPGGFVVPPQANSQRLRTPSPFPPEEPKPRGFFKLTKSYKHSDSSKPHKSRPHTSSHHHHSHSHTHIQTHQTHKHHSHKHGHNNSHSQAPIAHTPPVHSNPYPVPSIPAYQPYRSHSATRLNASPLPPPQHYAPSPNPAVQMPIPHKPPTTLQRFGPEFETPDHRRQQHTFQYSQCNRRKKAVCIGINYYGTKDVLKGAVNDATNVRQFLMKQYGYTRDNIIMLTDSRDENQSRRRLPTRDNIINAMRWLVKDAQPHDSLFFHYSGHGVQVRDKNGDETDGFDEAIVPLDFKREGVIIDDDMHMIMVRPLPLGCRLTALFDSCHSGTALDLPYIYSHRGQIKKPGLAIQAATGYVKAGHSYKPGDIQGIIDAMDGMMGASSKNQTGLPIDTMRLSAADAISLSGCVDSGKSYDTSESGAMSRAFICTLTKNPNQSYAQLLRNLRNILREGKNSQKPQLSSSHPIDTSIKFIA